MKTVLCYFSGVASVGSTVVFLSEGADVAEVIHHFGIILQSFDAVQLEARVYYEQVNFGQQRQQ